MMGVFFEREDIKFVLFFLATVCYLSFFAFEFSVCHFNFKKKMLKQIMRIFPKKIVTE